VVGFQVTPKAGASLAELTCRSEVSDQNSSAGPRSGNRIVYAAGAVLWRPLAVNSADPGLEIAVIHRPRYDDWSLPKGKVDPGETAPVAAVREAFEETGHHAVLGRRLDMVSYPIEQGVKKVYYWAARSTGGEFTPGREVDELVWLPVADAIKRLNYAHDRKMLCHFTKQPADTHTVLVVRHGTAGRKSRFSGDDTKRPLDKRGRAQAEALVAQLTAFGASDVYAADRLRCHQTVEPLAEELGVAIQNEPSLTEESYAKNPKRGRHRVLRIAAQEGTPVICTQGKVIPDLIAWWCERDRVRPDKSRNRKGSTWVLSLAAGRVVAANHIGSSLAANVRA
jgi:8-oxo-(d)GTP phosphatase